MTHILTLLLSAAFGLTSFSGTGGKRPACATAAPADTLRLMTYNIRGGVGMDNRRDHGRTARAISRGGADIVCVQEVDSMTRRSGRTFILADIARQTGMHATFSPAIDFDGGRYGIGMLSREKPLAVRRIALPGREEARTLLVCTFRDYIVACTHLSLTDSDRMASLDILRREARKSRKPFFLLGDWNDTPGSPFLQALGHDFRMLGETAEATFPADRPDERIDYVAIARKGSRRVCTLSSEVVPEPAASDHRPVIVLVDLGHR